MGGWGMSCLPSKVKEASPRKSPQVCDLTKMATLYAMPCQERGERPTPADSNLTTIAQERLLRVMKDSQATHGLLVLSAPGEGVARSPRGGMWSLPEKGTPKSLTNFPCRGKLPGGQESRAPRKDFIPHTSVFPFLRP